MDFWDLTKLLFRRWYVAGPLLLLTIVGTAVAAVAIQPDYVATSYVQLVPPSVSPRENEGAKPAARNPWLDLGLNSLGKAAILTVQDKKVVDALTDAGLTDNFTLTLDPALPIVTFEVIGDTKEQASETTRELIRRFDASVAALQADYGAVADQSITTRRLDLGDNLTESTSKVKRALVGIGGVGVLLTTALTVGFDAAIRRRRARALRRAGEAVRKTETEAGSAAASRPTGVAGAARSTVASAPPARVRPGSGAPPVDGPTVVHRRPGRTERDHDPERAATDRGTARLESLPSETTVVMPRHTWPMQDPRGNRL